MFFAACDKMKKKPKEKNIMVIRELYLNRIRPFYESEMIKVITGIRRCGKSTIMRQIIDELLIRRIDVEQIIYINFEDYKYRALTNSDNFYAYIEERIKGGKKFYLFFDEIQNVQDFEVVLNSFRATHNVSIFITGSNSKLLSGELATHLSGRTISFRVMPFNFKEFCEYQKQSVLDYDALLDEYMTFGGLPLVCEAKTEETKDVVLNNIYDAVVLKDIVMRNKVASPVVLEKVMDYVVANSSLTVSGNAIAGELSCKRYYRSYQGE